MTDWVIKVELLKNKNANWSTIPDKNPFYFQETCLMELWAPWLLIQLE